MGTKQIASVNAGFESLKHINEHNAEYWRARDLQPLLGYAQWRRFEQAIERAMASCEASGNQASHHFAGAGKPIVGGKGAVQLVDDYHLSRFACYLIAQNGDPRKPEIAQAQQYFAIQTRRQELNDQAAADVERLGLRKQTAEEFKALSGAAQDAGVQSKMFGVFHDAGYKGLYGGLGRDAIKQRKTNLLALKALEAEFAGTVKCVFIDPPYNTGSAFTHYEDGLEHSIWLGLMRDRLEIIRRLLADDGSLWITIDDNEAHYLKVMCDEVFGRSNFQCDIAWEKRYAPPPDTKGFGYVHDHILVYQKTRSFQRKLLPLTEDQEGRYKNPDKDSRGPWKAENYTCRYTADERPNLFYPVVNPNTLEEIWPKHTRVWGMSKAVHEKNVAENRIWWGVKGTNSVPALKNFLAGINQGMMPMSIWKHTLAGHNQDAMKEMLAIFGKDVFSTPKPEQLISVVLQIATNPGDLVLDSFAGSGTTGAVAHKMGRRWIMVELGEHCHTHIVPRLQKVIDGQDPGGVTQATGWQGGGGFRYYELAPTLLSTDRWGNLVINPEYDAAMLSAAMCKLEGFTYSPSELLWWQQGRSSESDFIYVTTQTLGPEQLEALSHEVGADPHDPRSLLVCCGAYRGVTAAQAAQRWPNLTLKKIPKMVKDRCEWGHDDYSLNVANLPMAQKKVEALPPQDDLFGGDVA